MLEETNSELIDPTEIINIVLSASLIDLVFLELDPMIKLKTRRK